MKKEQIEKSRKASINLTISKIEGITASFNKEIDKNNLEEKDKIIVNTKKELKELIKDRITERKDIFSREEVDSLTKIINNISDNLVAIGENPQKVKEFTNQIRESIKKKELAEETKAEIPQDSLQHEELKISQQSKAEQNKENKELKNIPTQEQTHARQASTNPIIRALENMVIAFAKCMDTINKRIEMENERVRDIRAQRKIDITHRKTMEDIAQKTAKTVTGHSKEETRLSKESLSRKNIKDPAQQIKIQEKKDDLSKTHIENLEKLQKEKDEKTKAKQTRSEQERNIHQHNIEGIKGKERYADRLKKQFGRTQPQDPQKGGHSR